MDESSKTYWGGFDDGIEAVARWAEEQPFMGLRGAVRIRGLKTGRAGEVRPSCPYGGSRHAVVPVLDAAAAGGKRWYCGDCRRDLGQAADGTWSFT